MARSPGLIGGLMRSPVAPRYGGGPSRCAAHRIVRWRMERGAEDEPADHGPGLLPGEPGDPIEDAAGCSPPARPTAPILSDAPMLGRPRARPTAWRRSPGGAPGRRRVEA